MSNDFRRTQKAVSRTARALRRAERELEFVSTSKHPEVREAYTDSVAAKVAALNARLDGYRKAHAATA